jgi:PKD repeat protein
VADFTSVLLVDDPTQEDIFAPVIVSVDASRAFIRGEGIISGYQWHVRDASGVLLNESSGRMNEILIASAGDVSLSLTITSDTEETATRTTNIRIQDSENLVANFNLTPNVSEPGLITLDANDSRSDDLEARPLNYSWTIADDKNTLLELSFAPAQISPPLLDVGVYTITLTVQDYRGVKDILVRSYTVPEAEAEN